MKNRVFQGSLSFSWSQTTSFCQYGFGLPVYRIEGKLQFSKFCSQQALLKCSCDRIVDGISLWLKICKIVERKIIFFVANLRVRFPVYSGGKPRVVIKRKAMAKPEYDKAMYRLTTIICRLNIGESLEVKELAEEFGVTSRTIQKDLNERLSHLPIERRDDGRYHFMGDYRLRGTSEPDAILVADLITAMIRNVDDKYTAIADNFIKGRSFSTSGFLFHLNLEDISMCSDIFRLLNQAVALRQQVGFLYSNNKGENKKYTAHPYRLANLKGFWYLLAYDLNEGRLKSFYLKKITALIIHPGNYQINSEIMAVLENFSDEIFSPWVCTDSKKVKLKADGVARVYLERNLPSALTVEQQDDTGLLLVMEYFADSEVLSLVKQWLPDIVILDNQGLNDKLKAEIEQYLEKNQS